MSAKSRLYKVYVYTILVLVMLFYTVPLLVTLSTSLKPENQVLSKTWQWVSEKTTVQSYKRVLTNYPFLRWTFNSVVVSFGTVLLTLVVSLPAAYAFARLEFSGKKTLFMLSLLTIMIPFFAFLPQLYLLFFYLKLLNTYISLIIPLSTAALYLFLFRQFIYEIPIEIDEAAIIDGCSAWTVFRRIILPLSKPVITTVVILSSIRSWNHLLWPLIAASDDRVKTLPVGLALNVFGITIGVMAHPQFSMIMAASILATLIPVIVFLVLQKYFVSGIATTGLK